MASTKVALVTGSGKRRVGRYVADALADRGYSLVIHYQTSAADAADAIDSFRKRGIEGIAVQADLSDEMAVRESAAAVFAVLGTVCLIGFLAANRLILWRWGGMN